MEPLPTTYHLLNANTMLVLRMLAMALLTRRSLSLSLSSLWRKSLLWISRHRNHARQPRDTSDLVILKRIICMCLLLALLFSISLVTCARHFVKHRASVPRLARRTNARALFVVSWLSRHDEKHWCTRRWRMRLIILRTIRSCCLRRPTLSSSRCSDWRRRISWMVLVLQLLNERARWTFRNVCAALLFICANFFVRDVPSLHLRRDARSHRIR